MLEFLILVRPHVEKGKRAASNGEETTNREDDELCPKDLCAVVFGETEAACRRAVLIQMIAPQPGIAGGIIVSTRRRITGMAVAIISVSEAIVHVHGDGRSC